MIRSRVYLLACVVTSGLLAAAPVRAQQTIVYSTERPKTIIYSADKPHLNYNYDADLYANNYGDYYTPYGSTLPFPDYARNFAYPGYFPYYTPYGTTVSIPNYSRFLNYGPYSGMGYSAIQPGSAGYAGLPVGSTGVAPLILPPRPYGFGYYNGSYYDPYYGGYYDMGPMYYGAAYQMPALGVNRSNWGLDNKRSMGRR